MSVIQSNLWLIYIENSGPLITNLFIRIPLLYNSVKWTTLGFKKPYEANRLTEGKLLPSNNLVGALMKYPFI